MSVSKDTCQNNFLKDFGNATFVCNFTTIVAILRQLFVCDATVRGAGDLPTGDNPEHLAMYISRDKVKSIETRVLW